MTAPHLATTWAADRTDSWSAGRPPTAYLHLDAASAGRASSATLEAVAAHALLEATAGGYVAQDQHAAAVERARLDVGDLLGIDAEGVAFVESASRALDALLDVWPLPAGARVGVAASSWGPNVETLRFRDLEPVLLPVDGEGVLDLDALPRVLATQPPDVLLVDQVAAHRGLVQPAAAVVQVARGHGVPVWVDAAQSIGHVDAVTGADAVFATSRKWLAGPRGVGMLAVAPEHRERLHVRRLAKHAGHPVVRRLESDEAHVAGRVGLGVALTELIALGPARVFARLADVGARTRAAIDDLPGWAVVQGGAPAGATTAIVPTEGQDVSTTRERLLHEHAVVTAVCLPWRAPLDMAGSGPSLRLSPHVDLHDGGLERLCRALAAR